MTFNATWTPGPEAVAGMKVFGMGSDRAGLVMYLHPDALAIQPPPNPRDLPEFLRLLREISTGAQELITFLEEDNPASGTPRHALFREREADSGAGM